MSNLTSALVVMAHGSRNAKANQEFGMLVDTLISMRQLDYKVIRPCFLELAEPLFIDLASELYEAGIRHIDFYPLFFNQGRHVQEDVPAQIAEVLERFEGMEVNLLPYFGANPALADVVASHIRGSHGSSGH